MICVHMSWMGCLCVLGWSAARCITITPHLAERLKHEATFSSHSTCMMIHTHGFVLFVRYVLLIKEGYKSSLAWCYMINDVISNQQVSVHCPLLLSSGLRLIIYQSNIIDNNILMWYPFRFYPPENGYVTVLVFSVQSKYSKLDFC